MTDLEILGCEVDFKNVQYGNLNEKETIADTVFTLNLNGNKIDIAIGNRLLLNVEMQQKTDPKQLGYDIVSRAIYYGASALRSTVSQGDTKYVGICKSYSVWFCSNSLDLSEIGNTQKGYKNIFKIARTHDDINLVEVNGANYDLIEIVMIDLPKLCKVNTREAEIIKTLFYETKEIFSVLKDNYNIQFNYEIKGVSEIMNFVKEMEIERAEARAEGRAEGEVKVYNKLGYTAEQIAKEVNLPLEDVQEIIDMLNNDY